MSRFALTLDYQVSKHIVFAFMIRDSSIYTLVGAKRWTLIFPERCSVIYISRLPPLRLKKKKVGIEEWNTF